MPDPAMSGKSRLSQRPSQRAGILDEHGVKDRIVHDPLLAQPRHDLLEDERHRPVANPTRGLDLRDRLGREPIDRGAEVLGDHHPLGVPAAQQLGGDRVALLHRPIHLQAVAIEPDVHALVQQALDVLDVITVTAVRDLDLLRRDPLLQEDLDLARARVRPRASSGP